MLRKAHNLTLDIYMFFLNWKDYDMTTAKVTWTIVRNTRQIMDGWVGQPVEKFLEANK